MKQLLIQARDALDLAQALLEKSNHHKTILHAYKALQAQIDALEPHPPHRQCECDKCKTYFAPEPEPVGHLYTIAGVQHCTITKELPDCALYTHPPAAREPLTPAQRVDIAEACQSLEFSDNFLSDIGRVVALVESKHKIGANP